jgi:hypothetical protein
VASTSPPQTVTLTARPDGQSRFVGWVSQDCAGTAPCTLTMDQARGVVAHFAPSQVRLTVVPVGAGSGRVTGNGIDCGPGAPGPCSVSLPAAPPPTVTLVATAGADSTFEGWSGPCGTAQSCTLTLEGTTVVTAAFAPRQYDVAIQVVGRGTGTVTGGGLSCTTGSAQGCTGAVPSGVVEFTAEPASGSFFAGWGGVCPRTTDPVCTVDFLGTGIVQAVFEPLTFELTVGVNGPGTVAGGPISCPAGACTATFPNVTPPAQVTLVATPTGGATFWGWSGACSGTGPCTVTMDGSRSAFANFVGP